MTKKKKEELFAEGPTIVESYKPSKDIHVVWNYRLDAKCIDAPAYVRGIPKTLPPYDPFLAYLEWKISKPWYERLFLP